MSRGVVYMNPEGKFVKVRLYKASGWAQHFSYEVTLVEDLSQATVFGVDNLPNSHQNDNYKVLENIEKSYIQLPATLETTRSVTIVKENA
ncbi:hypothetical protein [Vibrio phage RYC]|nr:hypothetical protein [Vibrio phage RYC]